MSWWFRKCVTGVVTQSHASIDRLAESRRVPRRRSSRVLMLGRASPTHVLYTHIAAGLAVNELHLLLRASLRFPASRSSWLLIAKRSREEYAHASEEMYSYFRSTVIVDYCRESFELQRSRGNIRKKKFEKVYNSNRIKWNNLLELWTIKKRYIRS